MQKIIRYQVNHTDEEKSKNQHQHPQESSTNMKKSIILFEKGRLAYRCTHLLPWDNLTLLFFFSIYRLINEVSRNDRVI